MEWQWKGLFFFGWLFLLLGALVGIPLHYIGTLPEGMPSYVSAICIGVGVFMLTDLINRLLCRNRVPVVITGSLLAGFPFE